MTPKQPLQVADTPKVNIMPSNEIKPEEEEVEQQVNEPIIEPEDKSELTLGDDELENENDEEENDDEKDPSDKAHQDVEMDDNSETWSLTMRDEQELEVEAEVEEPGPNNKEDKS